MLVPAPPVDVGEADLAAALDLEAPPEQVVQEVAVLAQPVGVLGRVRLAVPAHEREHIGVVVLRSDQSEPLDQADAVEASDIARSLV